MTEHHRTVVVTVVYSDGSDTTYKQQTYNSDYYSESDGYLRVFQKGKVIASFAPGHWAQVEIRENQQ